MNFSFQDFQDYIKQLCIDSLLVRHTDGGRKSFFRMDGEEALAAIPNNAASPYVVITGFSGRSNGKDGEKKEQTAELYFISKVNAVKGSRSDETEKAQQRAYEIMMQFIGRIKYDYETDDGCGDLPYLIPEKMSWNPVGPVNQLGYGWELSLSFKSPSPVFDKNNWK